MVSTGGGRVLTVTALGGGLHEARSRAYDAVARLAGRLGTGALTYRTDIAVVPSQRETTHPIVSP